MSLSTLVHTVTAAAAEFAGHTSSTPRRSYFGGPIHIPGADEDPWEGVPEHELERARLRLAADTARRQDREVQRVRHDAEMRRAARLVEVAA